MDTVISVMTKISDWANTLSGIVLFICLLILLPMAFIRRTRGKAAVGFLVSSYIFGTSIWFNSFIVAYSTLGGLWLLFGLIMGGVGVIPLAVIGLIWKVKLWAGLFMLFNFLLCVPGLHTFAIWLMGKNAQGLSRGRTEGVS